MKARHGLVIGKFYPPHAGHHLLVRAATGVSERVTVVVLAASVESIPLERRVAWMKAVHAGEPTLSIVGALDDHPVDYTDPAIWAAHLGVMQDALRGLDGPPVDAVFSSEAYGEELARRFSARHVAVDPGRVLAPVSGTAVRQDPAAHWEQLSGPVRGWFAKRVVIVGAESTGKSTLARALAEHFSRRGGPLFGTRWVPEYGRERAIELYLQAVARAALSGATRPAIEATPWRSEDFLAIAQEQCRREDAAAEQGSPLLIADTDAFATGIWHERYLGARSAAVEALADAHRPALYLLTHHDDVPFAQDGTRDGEQVRAWMTERFIERLEQTGRRWLSLRGSRQGRIAGAVSAIEGLMGEGWALAAPLG